jgi:flagellar assembly protein FliH
LQETGAAVVKDGTRGIQLFEYPAGSDAPYVPAWDAVAMGAKDSEPAAPTEPVVDHAKLAIEAGVRAEFEPKLAEETRKAFESGRERGRLEGRQAEHEAQAGAQEQRVRQAAELVENFAQERDRYMHAVEHEVVQLALKVTARILRREAQMDPLLLTGAVRVALGQLSGSTQVRLRVPPAELDLWTETIARLPKLAVKPEVVSGEGMLLGDCMIETELGSVDLGIRAQLGEIERGFFDRAGGGRDEAAAKAEPAAAQEVHA